MLPPSPNSHPFLLPTHTRAHAACTAAATWFFIISSFSSPTNGPGRMWIERRSSNLDQCQPQRTQDAWRNPMPAGSQSRRPLSFAWSPFSPFFFFSFLLPGRFRLFRGTTLAALATAVKLCEKCSDRCFRDVPQLSQASWMYVCIPASLLFSCRPRVWVYYWLQQCGHDIIHCIRTPRQTITICKGAGSRK